MTEYEKSQAGLPYIFDESMVDEYNKAAVLSDKYNRLTSDDITHQREALIELLHSIGENVRIMPTFHCEFGYNITIGNNVFINFNSILMDNSEIVIGDDVRIGPNASIYTVNHAINPEDRAMGICVNKSVHIGNKVWFGGDVKVLPGVTIGEGSVIGTGSVVTKDVPEGVIAAGNPCRVIRKITEEDKINI